MIYKNMKQVRNDNTFGRCNLEIPDPINLIFE